MVSNSIIATRVRSEPLDLRVETWHADFVGYAALSSIILPCIALCHLMWHPGSGADLEPVSGT